MAVKRRLVDFVKDPRRTWIWRPMFAVRGVVYRGNRYACPCCGGSFRSFSDAHGILSRTTTGYCPRCNAKARHRRIWLYLEGHTDLLTRRMRVLEIGPWWAFARRLQAMDTITYAGLDIDPKGPHVTHVGDATDMPFDDQSFDGILCVHILEHVVDDHAVIREMFRVLRPGGWALVNVPIDLDNPTDEDPTITDPADRKRRYGEATHVRLYGLDLRERLEEAGFDVEVDYAADIPPSDRERYGLRDYENIFMCTRPGLPN